MNYLAVARRDTVADARRRLGDDHLMPGERRCPRHGEPDDAGSDHKDLHDALSMLAVEMRHYRRQVALPGD